MYKSQLFKLIVLEVMYMKSYTFPDEGYISHHFISLHGYLALDNEKLVVFSI